jgi:hypothetical protein
MVLFYLRNTVWNEESVIRIKRNGRVQQASMFLQLLRFGLLFIGLTPTACPGQGLLNAVNQTAGLTTRQPGDQQTNQGTRAGSVSETIKQVRTGLDHLTLLEQHRTKPRLAGSNQASEFGKQALQTHVRQEVLVTERGVLVEFDKAP